MVSENRQHHSNRRVKLIPFPPCPALVLFDEEWFHIRYTQPFKATILTRPFCRQRGNLFQQLTIMNLSRQIRAGHGAMNTCHCSLKRIWCNPDLSTCGKDCPLRVILKCADQSWMLSQQMINHWPSATGCSRTRIRFVWKAAFSTRAQSARINPTATATEMVQDGHAVTSPAREQCL